MPDRRFKVDPTAMRNVFGVSDPSKGLHLNVGITLTWEKILQTYNGLCLQTGMTDDQYQKGLDELQHWIDWARGQRLDGKPRRNPY